MDDRELEEILSRYAPSAPASSLRDAVLSSARQASRAWPWAVAAAALLAMTIGFSNAADRLRPHSNDSGAVLPPAFGEAQLLDSVGFEQALEQAALVSAIRERDVPQATPDEVPWR